jgi:hypothetical protein
MEMKMKKLFNLHAEIGEREEGKHGYYLKILFSDGTEFVNETSHLSDAISSTAYQLKTSGMLARLADGLVKCKEVKIASNDPSMPKLKPGELATPKDLTQVDYPACQSICTSFDFFGIKKCKNMCAQRFGGGIR